MPGRAEAEARTLATDLEEPLIEGPKSHSAVISAEAAKGMGLPVEEADPSSERWRAVWRLWMKYAVLNAVRVYEGQMASYVEPRPAAQAA